MIRENAFVLLFVVLFCITVLTLVLVQYDITHPCSIVSSVMTGSALCAITLTGRWSLFMSVDTAFVVILSVMAFVAGGIWADAETKNKHVLKKGCFLCIGQYNIRYMWILLFAGLILLFTWLQFQEINEIAMRLGNKRGFAQMLPIVRKHIAEVKFSRWNNYENVLIAAILYSSLFVSFSNLLYTCKPIDIKTKLKHNWKYLLVVMLCLPSFVLTTGREKLVDLFLFMVVLGSILYQKNHRFDSRCLKNIYLSVVAAGLLLIVLFSVFLNIRDGKGIGLGDPLTGFTTYMGMPMPAFSYFIDNQTLLETPYIGGTTLIGVYRNLAQLGWVLPKPPVFLDFVPLDIDGSGYKTNVYTTMYRYIIDFGFIGNYLIMAIMGFFYAALYNFVRFYAKSFWILILYASLMMPLFLFMFDERFLSVVLSTTTIYKMIAIYLVCRFCINRMDNENVIS